MSDFYKKVAKIQRELKAPKNQFNSFGKYKYRSCEDILEGVKPLLKDLVLTVQDEVLMIGDRYYIKSTATISDGKESISNSAFARESLNKKGMDDSQVTGSTSSYARKYALNGLLCIDDTKDADSFDQKQDSIDIEKIAIECGWTVEQVLNSFNPPLKHLDEIQDRKACVEFLKANAM